MLLIPFASRSFLINTKSCNVLTEPLFNLRFVGIKFRCFSSGLFLELLAARGIDYFFANGGTDFGPIVEVYAKRLAGELPVPKPVTVPHEITAVAMAHGYTMVTGRPQVVMVHTIAGTANAVGGLINASRTQIPMLFTAGRTPTTESGLKGSRSSAIHWAQESFRSRLYGTRVGEVGL